MYNNQEINSVNSHQVQQMNDFNFQKLARNKCFTFSVFTVSKCSICQGNFLNDIHVAK